MPSYKAKRGSSKPTWTKFVKLVSRYGKLSYRDAMKKAKTLRKRLEEDLGDSPSMREMDDWTYGYFTVKDRNLTLEHDPMFRKMVSAVMKYKKVSHSKAVASARKGWKQMKRDLSPTSSPRYINDWVWGWTRK